MGVSLGRTWPGLCANVLAPKTSGTAWGCDLDDVGVGDDEINGG